ncbi:MAG: TraR/DksA C4-type zinc finger protein [Patescibacteria group bacterium]
MSATDKFIEKQKRALLEEKSRLEAQLAKLREYPDYGWDADDNIRETTDFENNMFLGKETEMLLQKVNGALDAIAGNRYGLCRKCRKSIEEKRLIAMPYADICVKCTPPGKKASQ